MASIPAAQEAYFRDAPDTSLTRSAMPPHAEISATDTAPRTRLIVRLLPLLALFLTGLALWWAGAADVLSLKQLAEHREMLRGFVAQHLVAALLTFMVLYVGVVALSLP